MRKHITLLFCLTLLLCNTGCVHKVQGDKPRICVILKTMSSEYWKFVEAGVNQACRDFGVEGTVVGPASEGNILDQVHLMEDVFNQRPDALIIAPILPSTITSILNRFQYLKLPILFVDTDAPWPLKTTYVGTDNLSAGKMGGQALAYQLKKGDKVALISGALGNATTDERIKGAKRALQEAGMKIVAEQPADSDKAKAMSVMENLLQTHPDIKGVFAANDEMALGALRAVNEAELSVRVMGTDGTVEAIDSISQDGLAGTVAQNPYMMGYRAVDNAVLKLQSKKVPKWINSGVELITKKNAAEKRAFLKRIRGEAK